MKTPFFFFFFFLSFINAQDVSIDQCLLTTIVTDFDTIPQPNTRMVIWNSKDSLTFSKELISDIEGKGSFIIDQGYEYSIKVFKADTSKVFNNILIKKLDYAYTIGLDIYMEVSKKYSQIFELDVNFASNSSIIPKESKNSIDQLYYSLIKDSNTKIELASHTDNMGDDQANMLLSQRRSESVKKYLVKKGINANRIEAQGYGEKQPKATNKTSTGRAINRRTEVRSSVQNKTEENVSI
jgi:outer membrane protein OmpA-like peptidoglycan-associated protein|tara:strand:- start:1121 stop:1837 length:717 start_codon:yes stop_codon:yes gene_type:complete